MTIANAEGARRLSNILSHMGSTQEVAVDYSAARPSSRTGGVRINMIPREGGNTFRGIVLRHRRQPTVRGRATTRDELQGARPDARRTRSRRCTTSTRRSAGRSCAGQAVVLSSGALVERNKLRRRHVRQHERGRSERSGPTSRISSRQAFDNCSTSASVNAPPDLAGDASATSSASSYDDQGRCQCSYGGGSDRPSPEAVASDI